jgi:hypothetical protein
VAVAVLLSFVCFAHSATTRASVIVFSVIRSRIRPGSDRVSVPPCGSTIRVLQDQLGGLARQPRFFTAVGRSWARMSPSYSRQCCLALVVGGAGLWPDFVAARPTSVGRFLPPLTLCTTSGLL